ncbi:hypothetical protein PANO111632_18460 [Paracoccus nototheniae]
MQQRLSVWPRALSGCRLMDSSAQTQFRAEVRWRHMMKQRRFKAPP